MERVGSGERQGLACPRQIHMLQKYFNTFKVRESYNLHLTSHNHPPSWQNEFAYVVASRTVPVQGFHFHLAISLSTMLVHLFKKNEKKRYMYAWGPESSQLVSTKMQEGFGNYTPTFGWTFCVSHTNTRLRRSPVNQCGHIIDPLPVPGSMGVGWWWWDRWRWGWWLKWQRNRNGKRASQIDYRPISDRSDDRLLMKMSGGFTQQFYMSDNKDDELEKVH